MNNINLYVVQEEANKRSKVLHVVAYEHVSYAQTMNYHCFIHLETKCTSGSSPKDL